MRLNLTNRRIRIGATIATLAAAIGFSVFGVGTTGAFFTDSHPGNMTGTVGAIRVTVDGDGTGTDGTNFMFADLMPGEAQTATITVTNERHKADVWLKFTNATALSALNNLGTYGHVVVTVDGATVFESANLNDRASTCGPFSPAGCWPLPDKIKLADNLATNGSVTVTFSFNYASKLSAQAPAGSDPVAWNTYPVASGQTTVNAADGTGNGLPFAIVATQHGQTP